MGSCSNKSKDREPGSIKEVKITSPISKKNSVRDVEKRHTNIESKPPDNEKAPSIQVALLTPSKPKDESRRSRKTLTLLTVEEKAELPPEFSQEKSPIISISEGKPEQGSYILIKNPISIGGRLSTNKQSDFEEKLFFIQGDEVKRDFLLDHGVWVCCKKGLKPESPNQDDFITVVQDNSLILGVFDGHGAHGHEISNFVHNSLPKFLLTHQSWDSNPLSSFVEGFQLVHRELVEFCNRPQTKFDCTISGSTATVACIKPNKLYVAHVGDSRCIIAKRSGDRLVAKEITRDHKPTYPDEKERIEKMGGEVKRNEGDIPYRVFVKNKRYPGIAMSRSLGDAIAQTIGVTCVPEVREVDLGPDDEFLLICSDGVWEFISNQEAVDDISKHSDIKMAAESLAQLAWNRWIMNEVDVVDDITVVLHYFSKKKY